MRLNLWDFDDTLVASTEATEKFLIKYPYIDRDQIWNNPNFNVKTILETLPILKTWMQLDNTPGVHWILTGRLLKPVLMWLNLWKDHPELGRIVRKIEYVASVSGSDDVSLGKKLWIDAHTKQFDEIHLFDDYKKNLDILEDTGVITHHMTNGHFLTASAKDTDSDIQKINNTLKSLRDLVDVSDKKTYSEIFRATIDILHNLQKDILKKLSTKEILDLISIQLDRINVEIEGDLKEIAKDLDGGKQVEVTISLKKTKKFIRHTIPEIYRSLHTTWIQIEAIFDQLSLPLICTVENYLYGDDEMPSGFSVVLWRME